MWLANAPELVGRDYVDQAFLEPGLKNAVRMQPSTIAAITISLAGIR
jgi:hypothetical protein